MSITRFGIQESHEETRLRARLDAVRDDLASATLELEELGSTLSAFEIRYDARVGVLLVELDRLALRIAEYRQRVARLDEPIETWETVEDQIREQFRVDWSRLDEEEKEATQASRRAVDLPPDPPEERRDLLRSLYRKLAREHHPDLARDDQQRRQNEAAMRRINAAFDARDLDALQRLEAELPVSDGRIPGDTVLSRIAWLVSQIARLEGILADTRAAIARLQATQLHALFSRCRDDSSLLGRVEDACNRDIDTRKAELDDIISEFRDRSATRFSDEAIP